MPSPESPANRMTTRSIRWGADGSMVVSHTLLLFVTALPRSGAVGRRPYCCPGPARRSSGPGHTPRARGRPPLTLPPPTGSTGDRPVAPCRGESGDRHRLVEVCLLYTSDAADEED